MLPDCFDAADGEISATSDATFGEEKAVDPDGLPFAMFRGRGSLSLLLLSRRALEPSVVDGHIRLARLKAID